MKKTFLMLLMAVASLTASAQYLNDSEKVFYEGKWMIGASASGFDLNYHGGEKWNIDMEAKAGYLFVDDWMVTGALGYQNSTYGKSTFKMGAGIRYYIEQNGIYVGLSGNYYHANRIDDFKTELNAGYAFFLSRHVTIEPELYYEQSFKDNDYSGFGARLGFALYF